MITHNVCLSVWLTSPCMCQSLSHVRLYETPCAIAPQAPLSMEFSRQELGSGQPFPPPGDPLDPRIKPRFPALQADSLLSEPTGKPSLRIMPFKSIHIATNSKISFFFMAEKYSIVYINIYATERQHFWSLIICQALCQEIYIYSFISDNKNYNLLWILTWVIKKMFSFFKLQK